MTCDRAERNIDQASVDWDAWADQVLDGEKLTRTQALQVLSCPDDDLLRLLAATFRVRKQHFGNKVHLYFLRNAKSGLCPEDCGYCSQSIVSEASIPRYSLQSEEQLLAGAARAVELQARTYCIVTSGRSPSPRELDRLTQAVRKIKQQFGLHICCCLGLLTAEQARQLKAAGVDRVNHNLNTSRAFYPRICSTHTYQDRLETLRACQQAGLELCSGLIVGMGETPQDLVDVAFEIRDLGVHSTPVNFLHAIDGTPLQGVSLLNPRECLKVLCMFRLVNPTVELRISGGREVHLRSLQPLGLYAANSMFVSDYLTTKGQPPEADYQMVADLGFEVVVGDHLPAHAVDELPPTKQVATVCSSAD
ncbi:MAG: biotin synthase [Planctomycetaceae bacterium]|nr:MAG: biotin synthase [Planctomycetaceae bacterium]